MRIFKTKFFARFAAHHAISDEILCDGVARANRGLIDADLGGGVIKQRLARPGEGKSGGFRSIILFHRHQRSFFIYAFAKNERTNIGSDELKAFRALAQDMLRYDDKQLNAALHNATLIEIICHDQKL
jgi:hypothetical protein